LRDSNPGLPLNLEMITSALRSCWSSPELSAEWPAHAEVQRRLLESL